MPYKCWIRRLIAMASDLRLATVKPSSSSMLPYSLSQIRAIFQDFLFCYDIFICIDHAILSSCLYLVLAAALHYHDHYLYHPYW